MEKQKNQEKEEICTDKQCPIHGSLKLRGRSFKGYVVKKFPRRVAIEFQRILYVRKYERQIKKRTKIHARLPDCMRRDIEIGDYIKVKECRPLSKIIHFAVVKKIRGREGESFELSKKDKNKTQGLRRGK